MVVLGAVIKDRPHFVAALTPEAIEAGMSAGKIIGQVAKAAGGGGGGKPDFARAGGKHASQLDAALALVSKLVREVHA